MLAWPFSSRRRHPRPTARPELEVLETRTACAVALTVTNVTGNSAAISTVPGAASTGALLGAALAAPAALPPGIPSLGQGVAVPGGLLDGVRAAAGDLPNFDPTQAMFQLGLSSVPQLLNPTGRGLLGGLTVGGGGTNYLFSERAPTPDFRGLDGTIGFFAPDATEETLFLPDEVREP